MPRIATVTARQADSRETDARGWANVLGSVPLFADLSRRHLNKVAGLGRVRAFHDGTAIVRAGDAGDTLYVVLDGQVSVRRRGLPALSLGIGSFFGEMALLDSGSRSATVVANGDVVCLAVTQARFLKLLRTEPSIAIVLLRELASRLRTVQAVS